MDKPMFNNIFREISMTNVKGYENLREKQKDLFDQWYKAHLSSMEYKIRQDYTESHLVKVDWNRRNRSFTVYFDNGTVFLYSYNGIKNIRGSYSTSYHSLGQERGEEYWQSI